METGAEIWIKTAEMDDWAPGTITQHSPSQLEIQVNKEQDTRMIPLENNQTQQVHLRHQCIPEEVNDLTQLIHLNEPAILHVLRLRYQQKIIFTKTRTILLAINPYEQLALFNEAVLERFRRAYAKPQARILQEKLPPHVYAVAAEAHKAMVQASSTSTFRSSTTFASARAVKPNQSILISGESGSGKTESSKFLMQYLAMIGSDGSAKSYGRLSNGESCGGGIAKKVLESTPVLESFGNARTVRNDNSSRFGKFIKLHFSPAGKLAGASVQTYLLERVRIIKQSQNERNYHIFYEMCCGADDFERERWHLLSPEKFTYLNQSGCLDRRDKVDDGHLFDRTVEAMQSIGFTTPERESIFQIVSGILHMGNFQFIAAPSQSSGEMDRAKLDSACQSYFDSATELLELDPNTFLKALSTRKIKAGNEYVTVNLSPEQIDTARDGITKSLYSWLFEWIVSRINSFLDYHGVIGDQCSNEMNFIGILDIFGFEIFPHNSFEQLCINYANETLQQQFNEYVFKIEQEEYQREKVDWKYVDFPDNQPILDLISQKHTGILALIDEESLFPKGSDASLSNKIKQRWESHHAFESVRIQKAGGYRFIIHHYAGPVTYSIEGFLGKNKDQLNQDAIDLLLSSNNQVIQSICQLKNKVTDDQPTRKRIGFASSSVSLQFKRQLTELLATIRDTAPHYIRCLKPNDESKPGLIRGDRVGQQLKCSGVLEAVRVARAGFPIRMPHEEFLFRYQLLTVISNSKTNRKDMSDSDKQVLVGKMLVDIVRHLPRSSIAENVQAESDSDVKALLIRAGIQKGVSKIFMRRKAYNALENLRLNAVSVFEAKVFALVMGYRTRKRYCQFRNAIRTLQSRFYYKRAIKAKRDRQRRKEMSIACLIIQGAYRNWVFERKKKLERERRHAKEIKERKVREAANAKAAEDAKLAAEAKAALEQAEKAKLEKAAKKAREVEGKESKLAAIDTSDVALEDGENFESLAQEMMEQDEKKAASTSGTNSLVSTDKSSPSSLHEVPRMLSHHDPRMSKQFKSIVSSPSSRNSPRHFAPGSNGAEHEKANMAALRPLTSGEPSISAPGGNSTPNLDEGRSTASLRGPSRSTRVVSLPKLGTVQQAQWVNDADRFSCHICNKRFNFYRRKHHCRACGEVICSSCSLHHRIEKTQLRVCVSCVAFHAVDSPNSSKRRFGRSLYGGSSTAKTTEEIAAEADQSLDEDVWSNPWPEPPMPENEEERLKTLRRIDIQSLGKGMFNMFCDVAARTLKCPIAAVSIIEEDEQIFLASLGMSKEALPRELSFDTHTICETSPLVILDTRTDPRFRENPMVKGAVKIRFYAGASVVAPNGHVLGTVSVYDTKTRRHVDPADVSVLQNLSALAADKMSNVFEEDIGEQI